MLATFHLRTHHVAKPRGGTGIPVGRATNRNVGATYPSNSDRTLGRVGLAGQTSDEAVDDVFGAAVI